MQTANRPSLRAALLPPIGILLCLATACGGDSGDDFPELTPFPSEIADRLHQIRDRVSSIRGLTAHPVAIEGTLSPEGLQTYTATSIREASEEELADLDAYGLMLKTLSLVPQEFDLRQFVFEDYAGLVGGLYFYEEDRLVLVTGGEEIGLQDELELAHEYTHSLQDGAFELEDLIKSWTESDLEEDGFAQYSETLDCLIEGDATYTARLYAEQVFGPDWRAKVEEEAAKGAVGEEPELPEFLSRAVSFNYGDCAAFVENLHKEGGWEAVNEAYRTPPATTEQILQLDKYRGRELANTAPPKDLSDKLGDQWRQLDSTQFGAFDVFNYALTLTQDPQTAVTAAFGWGAGWINVYRSEQDTNRVLVQLFLGFDSDVDLLEFLVTYDLIVTKLGGQVRPVDGRRAQWSTATQFGHIARHPNLAAVQIVIATDQATVDLVTGD